MYIYMIEWILLCVLGVLFKYYKINSKKFLFISFFTMALIIGFRASSVGEDTRMYLSIAEASKNLSFSEILKEFPKSTWSYNRYGFSNKIETIYLLYNKVIVTLFNNTQLVFIITALITCYGFGKFIYDNSVDIYLSTYVFLCEFFFMASFNLMRQLFSIAIAINSYTLIKKHRYKKAVLLIFIASLFHQSSIIYLGLFVLFSINKYKLGAKFIAISSIFITIMPTILYKITIKFSPYYASYFESNYWQANANGIVFLWIIEIFIISMIYFKGFKNKDEFITVSTIILYLAFEILALRYTAISRLAINFRVFLLLLFPIFKKIFKGKEKIYYIIIICLILFLLYFKNASSEVRFYRFFNIN